MEMISRCAALVCLLVSGLVTAAGDDARRAQAHESVASNPGFDLNVRRYPAEGSDLLIWLPSKSGIQDGHSSFADAIRNQGIDFWLVDLHESYNAPTGSRAYAEFDPTPIRQLIDRAIRQGWQRIFLGGESRGAALALRAARQWQLENPDSPRLRGMLFYHPNLTDGYTAIGEQAILHPVTRLTNLPIYIFQPQFNTGYLHSAELAEQLGTGGAAVYLHYLEGIRGGFHVRDVDSLTTNDIRERGRVGRRIHSAMQLLAGSPPPSRAAKPLDDLTPLKRESPDRDNTLVPLTITPALPLRLQDSQGRMVDLQDLNDEVVLVNFWASWCGPCVQEIASLVRLVDHFDDRPFRVLAVNIGETESHINGFFDALGVTPNFDVLHDHDGDTAKAWRVYAVPSTYLLDRQQNIRYGYRGALPWDRPDIIETVDQLLE